MREEGLWEDWLPLQDLPSRDKVIGDLVDYKSFGHFCSPFWALLVFKDLLLNFHIYHNYSFSSVIQYFVQAKFIVIQFLGTFDYQDVPNQIIL